MEAFWTRLSKRCPFDGDNGATKQENNNKARKDMLKKRQQKAKDTALQFTLYNQRFLAFSISVFIGGVQNINLKRDLK